MSSTHLNLARAVCRRAERAVYPLIHAEQVDAEVGRYLNRLSDFLFAATRAAALREGREELLWKKWVLVPKTKAPVYVGGLVEEDIEDDEDVIEEAMEHNKVENTPIRPKAADADLFDEMDDNFFDPSIQKKEKV